MGEAVEAAAADDRYFEELLADTAGTARLCAQHLMELSTLKVIQGKVFSPGPARRVGFSKLSPRRARARPRVSRFISQAHLFATPVYTRTLSS